MNTLKSSLEHTGVPGIYAAQGDLPGTAVTVLGAVHGNERAGWEAIKQLIAKSKDQPIHKGKLIAAIGNPLAMENNQRFVHKDLNRCFGKNADADLYEEIRAGELKPFLAGTDLLLDIHSTIKPSDPFIVVPSQNGGLTEKEKLIITKLGIPTVLTGAGLWHHSGQPIYADTFVHNHGGIGITIEAGWIDDPKTLQIIHGVNSALHHLGVFQGEYPQSPKEIQLNIWHAYKNIVAEQGFNFTKNGSPEDWKNWEDLPGGTVYAMAQGKEYIAEKDSYIVFPKPKNAITIGDEVCILVDAKKQSM